MNKKRWLAAGIAAVILIISLAVPNYKAEKAAWEDQFSNKAKDIFGENALALREKVIEAGDSSSRILYLSLDGVIASGSTPSVFATNVYSHDYFLAQLDKAYEDDSVKGVLFSVNTPGGGVYESAEIRNRILKLKEKEVPIYVSMKNLAASGGYYVSADADKIFASPETWTGSIGVISQVMDFTGLMEKYGVKAHTYASGDMKAMGSSYRTPTEEEVSIWNELTREAYDQFVALIANGRGMSEAEVRKLADGRIYSGKQALNNGLVDELGYEEDALAALRTDKDLEGAELFEYTFNDNPFMGVFGQFVQFKSERSELAVLESIIEKQMNSAPMPYYLYGGK